MVPKRKRNVKVDPAEKYQIVDLEELDFSNLEEFTLPPIDSGMEAEEEKELHLKKIIDSGSGHIPIPVIKEVENPAKDFYKSIELPHKYINWKEDVCNSYFMDENDNKLCDDLGIAKEDYLKVVDEIENDAFVKIENEDKLMETRSTRFDHYDNSPVIRSPIPNKLLVNNSTACLENSTVPDNTAAHNLMVNTGDDVSDINRSNVCLTPAIQDYSSLTLSLDLKERIKSLARYKRLIRDEDSLYPSYVCFRRRVLKPSRKNRRSEGQTYEKVIRLNSELELLEKLTTLRLKVAEINDKIYDCSFEIAKTISKIQEKYKENGHRKIKRVYKKFKAEQNKAGITQQEDIYKNILFDRDRIRMLNKRLRLTKENISEEEIENTAIGYTNHLRSIHGNIYK